MWDSTVTFQYMPKQYITWWVEAAIATPMFRICGPRRGYASGRK